MFYVVRALSPYTEYEFYVIAVNNIGRGPPSVPATTTTGETGNVAAHRYGRHFTSCLCSRLPGIFVVLVSATLYLRRECFADCSTAVACFSSSLTHTHAHRFLPVPQTTRLLTLMKMHYTTS